uniref:Uncharacterized protein n=1 Tax=Pseudo-nitzschia delicatissima TaxID=44447 RepID=A0A7S0UKK4_9STRA|mmetsp:Transcript_4380/g.9131  ORF Transcript_4380/g.9131 Transcript_4380/m.9131 type:complete len:546 (+) Transcript_4380:206-1843(+)
MSSPTTNSEERNTEIWSTRIQRELLALTTDNATEKDKKEMTDVLPAFCSVKEHKLDIERGNCTVTCVLDLPSDTKTYPITITFDLSLKKKADGSIDTSAVSYPFQKPTAIVSGGSGRFPEGSTAADGDCIDIEMDWTPSLHLSDAVLNVALNIKECLSQGEPLYAAEIPQEAKRGGLGATVGATIRNLTDKKKGAGRWGRKKRAARPKATAKEVRIGDEINMLEAPWVDCQGVYSCKAIRRPKFAEEAIQAAESKVKQGGDNEVASAGFAGAGAMFRNITNSTRGLLEESFLMITESHIIEMRSNKLNLSTGTVTFAIPIAMMAKLKFRRQESVSLFFKPAPDDPLIYMCPDSADCVHQIQAVLKRHGVKGKHTNAATHRAINQALHLVQEIQTKELALKHDPSIERVNEIMDLYRQAAERFEVAGDVRHEEVVTHMRKFLALPLTVSVLDGSYKKPAHATDNKPIATEKSEPSILDKKFEDNMDDLLAEAESDLKEMKGSDDVDLEDMYDDDKDDGITSTENTIAEFENMLKEADEELAALMNS